MKKLLLLLLIGWAWSENITVEKIEGLLGKNYQQVFSQIGLPVQIFPVRQNDKVMDDIVMVYEAGDNPYYLYFYNNHYYRVLIPSISKVDFYGIKIGDNLKKIQKIKKDTLTIKDDYAHYQSAGKHYLFNIKNNRISSIWIALEKKPVIPDES